MPSFFLIIRRPPRSPLFPYPPLFRSGCDSIPPGFFSTLTGEPWRFRTITIEPPRSEEHTSELQSPYVISYAVFFFNNPATTEISPLPLPAPLPFWMRFNPTRILLDPYGRAVAVPDNYDRTAPSPGMKSVVVDCSAYEWESDKPLNRASSRTVIYEMHV